MKRFILIIVLLLLFATGSFIYIHKKTSPNVISKHLTSPKWNYSKPLLLARTTILTDTAKTPDQKAQGLSNEPPLSENQGLLFDFSGPDDNHTPGFWMKDMLFPIDIVWIKDNTVVFINENVPTPNHPNQQLPIYYPPQDIDFVLELPAGWSKRHNLVTGNKIGNP